VRIGEAARDLGLSERTLRYYEERGLVQPTRGEGGQRRYAERDLRALRHVRTLLAAGLGTSVIAELLPCMRDDDGHPAPACAELVVRLDGERDRIAAAIADLESARATLDAVIARAPAATEG
jgi:DNA-binding transcriptional MerR regulator